MCYPGRPAGRVFDVRSFGTGVAQESSHRWAASESTTSGDASDHTQDRVTKFVYNEADQVTHRIALDVSGDGTTTGNEDQDTRYVYDAELDTGEGEAFDPVIEDGTRLRAVIYPDSDDTVTSRVLVNNSGGDNTYDRVEFTYYADGPTKTRKDQRGAEHTYVYDDLGHVTTDRVTVLGGADDHVKSITYAYDDLGRRTEANSWSGDNGNGDQRNAVELAYNTASNGWGVLTTSYQEHYGAKDANTVSVQYGYAEVAVGSGKTIRLTQTTYPYTRAVYHNYPANGIGAALNRVNDIADGDGAQRNKWVEYTAFLGARTLVQLEYPQVTVNSNPLILTYGGGGAYGGFDQFGRIKDQTWEIKTAGTDKDCFSYGYDPGGNRLWRENKVDSRFSELYHSNGAALNAAYDGLDRMVDFRRGTLSEDSRANDTIDDDVKRVEDFGLDQVGNWATFKSDANGVGWDLEQTRSHNDVNEISSISETSGDAWVELDYDMAGNMTEGPRPSSPYHTPGGGKNVSEQYRLFFVYDAWNRPVEVYEDTDDDGVHDTTGTLDKVIAEYRYDGLGRRIVKLVPTTFDQDNVPTYYKRTDYYYNRSWQVLQECFDGNVAVASKDSTVATTRKAEYVWDVRYIDAPVVRWYDDDDGDFADADEELYCTQDANFNVTALVATDGAVVERYAYDPYGKVTVLHGARDAAGTDTSGSAWSARTSNTFCNEVLYCGYRFDPETGLYHVRNRMYHPRLGRWLQRDPGPGGMMPAALRIVGSPVANGEYLGASGLRQIGSPRQSKLQPVAADFHAITSGLPSSPGTLSPDSHYLPWSTSRVAISSPQGVLGNPYADGMNLYQYCRGNPPGLTDPTGEIAPAILVAAGLTGYLAVDYYVCATPLYDEAMRDYGARTDKFRHCWVSCKMSRRCGGLATQVAGLGKEARDSLKRILKQMDGGTGDWVDSLMDLEANNKCIGWESYPLGPIGGWIGAIFRGSCECCCNKYYK